MAEKEKKPLLVYSASAGSGKTFSLVQSYLKLVLGNHPVNGFNPNQFSHILAMTFTNKAALEMRERIIQALNWLAHPNSLTDGEKKKVTSIINGVIKSTKLSPQEIEKRAGNVLSNILHNYADFNVLTIDKFSLRLIRTFSKDLDLQDNFKVSLDADSMLNEVIDELISRIGVTGEEEITNLTVTYAKRNSDDGNRWDFKDNLADFSKVLTKERDQKYIKELLQQTFDTDTYENIQNEIKQIEIEHQTRCKELFEYFVSLGTSPEEYYQGGKSGGMFHLLSKLDERSISKVNAPNSYITAYLNNDEKVLKKPMDAQLLRRVQDLITYEEDKAKKYFTLQIRRKDFYNLALLKFVANELEEYKEKENIIGIYEFGLKISTLLSEEKAPYIYERLGNRYNHYLLDEFQDTSRLQWLNLIPLVHESISHNHDNLIVGDPKQAIYRFRNGLVEQFVALPEIYNPEKNQNLQQISHYFKIQGKKLPLQDNYRSSKEIVQFNNDFFLDFLARSPKNLSEYYADIKQNPMGNEGGAVHFHLEPKKTCKEDIFLLDKVDSCIKDGFSPGDICVLCRNNKEGNLFAQILINAGYAIVSSDSLIVSSDKSVQLCIDYINLRRNEGNKSLQIKFATTYLVSLNKDPVESLLPYWINQKVGNFNFIQFAIDFFGNINGLFFPYENMYDLGKKLMKILHKDELSNPYLHHLMELFQEFDLHEGPDIRVFMERWHEKLYKSSLQMPENENAIRIMTVHKSKGLEFPIVIMPKVDWNISTSRNTHFLFADDGSLLYTRIKQQGKDYIPDYMVNAYNEEYERVFLDELNTLYVAFTRPIYRLYVYLEESNKEKEKDYSSISQVITEIIQNWNHPEIATEITDNSFQIGELHSKVNTKAAESEIQEFHATNLTDFLWFPKLALQDEEALDTENLSEEQQKGNQIHLALSRITHLSDITSIIEELTTTGKINKQWKDEIAQTVEEVLQLLSQQAFVSTANQTINEQDIIINETEMKRPDKIYISDRSITVVDFKSGTPRPSYKKQVNNYCIALNEMSGKPTEGYLLYTKPLRLEKVI
ncbi:MAG: UvrD-helicase domain-containing protein [Brumimicrobium sp.]|nr:UvrD-helicase domain-containing protein [Brumimicrobium sp.]